MRVCDVIKLKEKHGAHLENTCVCQVFCLCTSLVEIRLRLISRERGVLREEGREKIENFSGQQKNEVLSCCVYFKTFEKRAKKSVGQF